MKSPIFLFSLPRSGSTLLQRILMSHSQVASVAEPWLMLPFNYAYKKDGILTEYSHNVAYAALDDFIENLPKKQDDYYDALGTFANTLYEKQCLNNEIYFLDKTPRYYHIIPEIVKTFPDAKFLFLFRNPLHIMSSVMRTWCNDSFKHLHNYEQDFNLGFRSLAEGYQFLGGRAYAIQYEQFVSEPIHLTKEICAYLEIEFEEEMLVSFSHQDTRGRVGDPTGIKDYQNISTNSLDKWKVTFNTPLRKKIIHQYINSIESEVFNIQGYDKQQILKEIDSLEELSKFFIKDRLDLTYSVIAKHLKLNQFLDKKFKWGARDSYLS